MPVLKSTFDNARAKHDREVRGLIRQIENGIEQRDLLSEQNDELRRALDLKQMQVESQRDIIRGYQRETGRITNDAAHQHADLERMTHERDEALSCMNAYGLVIEVLLDECDDLRNIVDDLRGEISELVDATFTVDVIGTVTVPGDFEQAA